jgi:hypothetical protein
MNDAISCADGAHLRVVGYLEIGRLGNFPKGATVREARPDGFGVRQPALIVTPKVPC